MGVSRALAICPTLGSLAALVMGAAASADASAPSPTASGVRTFTGAGAADHGQATCGVLHPTVVVDGTSVAITITLDSGRERHASAKLAGNGNYHATYTIGRGYPVDVFGTIDGDHGTMNLEPDRRFRCSWHNVTLTPATQ